MILIYNLRALHITCGDWDFRNPNGRFWTTLHIHCWTKVFIHLQKIHVSPFVSKGAFANHLKLGCNTPILFLYSLKHISIYPRSGTRGLQRFTCLKYYNALKRESSLYGWTLQKDRLYWKILRSKFVQNYICYKKLSGSISLSILRMELGSPKICVFEIL